MKKIGVGNYKATELEKEYVIKVLESGQLSQGKYVKKFEDKFSKIHGNKYGVMCSSGTAALHIALLAAKEAMQWEDGAEVLVPAITFISTSNACIHAGLHPKFVDVDPLTYNMSPIEAQKRISSKTKAIIAVHAFGQPCEMDELIEISNKYNLILIEDCAESHFAKYRGKTVGSFGVMGCFSTYVAHTITTGVGGIVITNNRALSEICRSLIAHGRVCSCEVCALTQGGMCSKRITNDIDNRFSFERLGYSYRVGELEGAIGLAQLQKYKENIDRRRRNAFSLNNQLDFLEDYIQLPLARKHVEHTYMMYPILVRNESGIKRSGLVSYLEMNYIETRPMLPILNQPIYRKMFGDIESEYPVAKNINNNGFYIGNHSGMEEEDIDYIVGILKAFFRK